MFSVTEHTTDTLEVKQSKFIAHLLPYAMFDEILEELKSEHPKARHFVTAFRYLNDYDQIVEGCSDDGEPKGTSGKPTLAVLQGHDLINTAVITVRYFGGTKLGTGGLVRAYSDAANLVIDGSRLIPYLKEHATHFECDYQNVGRVEYLLEQCNMRIVEKAFEPLSVKMHVSGTEEETERFLRETDRIIKIS